MPTVTRKQIEQARAEKEAKDANVIYDAVFKVDEAAGVTKFAEVLKETAKNLSPAEIGTMLAELIREGKPNEKKTFLKQYLELMRTYERTHAELSETQVSRLTDQELDGLLAEHGIREHTADEFIDAEEETVAEVVGISPPSGEEVQESESGGSGGEGETEEEAERHEEDGKAQ